MHPARFALAAAVVSVIIGADQLTKMAASRFLPAASHHSAAVRMEVVRNTRAGIAMFTVSTPVQVLIGALAGVSGSVLVLFADTLSALSSVGLAVAIGAAASNFGDIIVRGHILDFVSIRQWPTFNLADVALCAGLLTTAIGLL